MGLLVKPPFSTFLIIDRTERTLLSLTRVVKPQNQKMSEGSEDRLAMGRLVQVGQLYDVRQDKVLVSLLFKTFANYLKLGGNH